MSCGPVEKYVAKTKMSLKNSNYCLSFVNTLWRGEVIMCTFNNLNKSIIDIYCAQVLDQEDVLELESMITDFIFGSN